MAYMSLSGRCENGCGGIQSPTAHGGDDKCWTSRGVGQGKFAPSHRNWSLRYWLRRWVAAKREKIQ